MLKNNIEHIQAGKIGIIVIVAFFIALAIYYSIYVPLWSPPDEVRHYAYCEYIAKHHALPYLKPGDDKGNISQAVHPPLYYIIGALFCHSDEKPIQEVVFIDDGPGANTIVHPDDESRFPYAGKARQAHLMRCVSIVFGALTVVFVYLLVLNIYDRAVYVALASAAFVATLPQFLHVSASISNENLSTALGTLYLILLCDCLNRPARLSLQVISGVVLGCSLLTKTSAFIFIPLTAITFLWCCLKDKSWQHLKSLVTIVAIASIISGWWYGRNWLLYHDPLFTKALEQIQPYSLRSSRSVQDAYHVITATFTSFFGYFGSLQFPILPMHKAAYLVLMLLSFIGLLKVFATERQIGVKMGIMLLAIMCGLGFYVMANIRYSMAMGRYLFVVIGPLALLFCMGIRGLLGPQIERRGIVVFPIMLACLSIDILLRVVMPSYAHLPLAEIAAQKEVCCASVDIETESVTQTFVCTADNLSCIRVLLSCPEQGATGEFVLSLQEVAADSRFYRKMVYPATDLYDLVSYYFSFPPVQGSRNKTYAFTVALQHVSGHIRAGLIYEQEDRYQEGSLTINSVSVPGDLFFAAYGCTDPLFAQRWREDGGTSIRVKRYVDFNELQLYNEMSSFYRLKSPTHQKIEAIGRLIRARSLEKQ